MKSYKRSTETECKSMLANTINKYSDHITVTIKSNIAITNTQIHMHPNSTEVTSFHFSSDSV